jgi:hypothetical protein
MGFFQFRLDLAGGGKDTVDEAPVAFVIVKVGQFFAPDHHQAEPVSAVRAQHHEETFDIVQAAGILVLDLGTVEKIDVAAFDDVDVVGHGCVLGRVGNLLLSTLAHGRRCASSAHGKVTGC